MCNESAQLAQYASVPVREASREEVWQHLEQKQCTGRAPRSHTQATPAATN